MKEIIASVDNDENFKAYIIWLPMLTSDNRNAAIKWSNQYTDPRVVHFWDGEQITGMAWQKVMDMPQVAWDIYFLYDENSEWDKEPTKPQYFMHQLRGLPSELMFDKVKMQEQTHAMLKD